MADQYTGVVSAGAIVKLDDAVLELYALDMLHEAQGVMRYEEFAVYTDDLTKQPGDTIQVTKVDNLARGGELQEHVPLEAKAMSQALVPIVVTEYGNAVGVSEKLLLLSRHKELQKAAKLLGRDYAVVRDLNCRDALVASGNTIFANPTGAALADVGSSHTFNIEAIRDGLEELSNVNAPKFYDDYYVCFIHPHQARYLREDPDWISANNYANTRNLFTGEIGRWEDVIFVETTHQGNGAVASTHEGYEAALDGTGAAAINLFRATLFADQAYAVADALTVEMRDGGVSDFGRKHALAWYAIWGTKALESTYIQHIISA
jgi:N4-gp56 family major capsid protein